MSWTKLSHRISQGDGQGHFDAYKPWIRIRRRNPSKRGNQESGDLPGYTRRASFLSRTEWYLALLALWLGAVDVREQFPAWPMPHVHPLADFPGTPSPSNLRESRGLIAIAESAGIDHGWEVGAPDVPYVATIDLALTHVVDEQLRLTLLAAKPHEQVEVSSPASSTIERLELQRRYAHDIGASFAVPDQSLLGCHLGANLENFSSATSISLTKEHDTLLTEYAEFFNEFSAGETLSVTIANAQDRFNLNEELSDSLYRAGVWQRRIDIDLTEFVVMSWPRRSGAAVNAALHEQLFATGAAS